jgi:hypothetical protein
LLQDLGFLAFTLPQVEILMPTKKPRGEDLTREQQGANQELNRKRSRGAIYITRTLRAVTFLEGAGYG